jgi:glycosyltransferase involved in cell wall biosynthesis
MRVLVVPKWYPWPDRPAFGIFCREQARALARRHEVVVLAADPVTSPEFGLFELADGVEDGVRTLRLRYRRPRLRPAAMACQLVGMVAALRRLRRDGWVPEVVHAHVYSAGLPALVVGRAVGATVVVSEHYTGFQRGLITGYDRLTARIAFRWADLVAPVSADLAAYIQAVQPRARIRVVGNVVDTDVFHPSADRRLPDGSERLLTVGALVQKKGHAYLFEALAALRDHRTVSLRIVGDGELRGELEATAQRMGLQDVVEFDGERPKEEVAELMRDCDLFVLPSLFENQPCVLLEAMATGLPSVATAVGGVPELLDGAGVMCAARDSTALASAISDALDRRAEFDPGTLASNARSRFGYQVFAERWSEIYAELRSSSGTTA